MYCFNAAHSVLEEKSEHSDHTPSSVPQERLQEQLQVGPQRDQQEGMSKPGGLPT